MNAWSYPFQKKRTLLHDMTGRPEKSRHGRFSDATRRLRVTLRALPWQRIIRASVGLVICFHAREFGLKASLALSQASQGLTVLIEPGLGFLDCPIAFAYLPLLVLL